MIIYILVNMLIRLSEKYKTIRVKQNNNEDVGNERRYFFGVYHVKWTSVILEMFSGILDALIIVNSSFPHYLSNDDIDLLRQVCPPN